MRAYAWWLGMLLLAGIGRTARCQEVSTDRPPACEPGYKWVEAVEYREVERRVCKVVPDKRTKWVYRTEPDYYCIPVCSFRGLCKADGCPSCAACQGPYCRSKLFKKLVEWECGTKCVVEVVKEKVPCVVWRKVPCEPGGAGEGGR